MLKFDIHKIPDKPAQITSDFLMPILRSAGVLQQATIATINIESLTAMMSFNAQIARLHLGYDRYEAEAPRSLIVKLPTLNSKLQQNAAIFRPGLKECWFYRRGAAQTPDIYVPHCYYNVVDSGTGESFLLLEDLAPAQVGDRLSGASLNQAKLALKSLAHLHAAWWAFEPLKNLELKQLMNNAKEAQALVVQLYQEAWPHFLNHADFQIPIEIRELGEGLVSHIPAAEALLDSSPRTLIHGDFRLENILFGSLNRQSICWIIDWEDIMLWNGMFDVAYFLSGCPQADKSEKEDYLLHLLLSGIDSVRSERISLGAVLS